MYKIVQLLSELLFLDNELLGLGLHERGAPHEFIDGREDLIEGQRFEVLVGGVDVGDVDHFGIV